MTPGDLELIDHLCTRIGMIMEDASAIALLVGTLDQEGQRIAIAEIAVGSANVAALIAAVQALLD